MRLLKKSREKILSIISFFLFPPKCISCGKENEIFCSTCIGAIPLATQNQGHIISVFSYDSPEIRKAVWSFKYKNNHALAKYFARSLHDKILEELNEQHTFHGFTKPLLIPIPLHKKRKRFRGYNQAELLCKEMSFIDPEIFDLTTNVLYKHIDTLSQTKTSDRKARLQNIKGCFAVRNTEKISNRNIILIDDITTTGATLNEASKVLKKSGAKKIICFTVAH